MRVRGVPGAVGGSLRDASLRRNDDVRLRFFIYFPFVTYFAPIDTA